MSTRCQSCDRTRPRWTRVRCEIASRSGRLTMGHPGSEVSRVPFTLACGVRFERSAPANRGSAVDRAVYHSVVRMIFRVTQRELVSLYRSRSSATSCGSSETLLSGVRRRRARPPRFRRSTTAGASSHHFDDGFRNNLRFAVPELERLGLPALFHLTTAYMVRIDCCGRTNRERVLQWSMRSCDARRFAIAASDGSASAATLEVGARNAATGRIARDAYLDRLREGGSYHLDEQLRELHDFLTWNDVRENGPTWVRVGRTQRSIRYCRACREMS